MAEIAAREHKDEDERLQRSAVAPAGPAVEAPMSAPVGGLVVGAADDPLEAAADRAADAALARIRRMADPAAARHQHAPGCGHTGIRRSAVTVPTRHQHAPGCGHTGIRRSPLSAAVDAAPVGTAVVAAAPVAVAPAVAPGTGPAVRRVTTGSRSAGPVGGSNGTIRRRRRGRGGGGGGGGGGTAGPVVDPTQAPTTAQLTAVISNARSGSGSPLPGHVGGRRFQNRPNRGKTTPELPTAAPDGTPITYTEWDVHPHRRGVNRGPHRVVTGSDGSAWYTADHYTSFTRK